ncbi:alpha/beta fold hydrolase [Candidatus Sumerlaeota bacterium]|nr:alpha/beta fold hydrolase [Candidatus Sumerlaeota bacterium]
MPLTARQRKWAIGAVITLGAALMLNGCADRLFYVPSRAIYAHPREMGLKYEDVYFSNADGNRLHGFLLMPSGNEQPIATVVHAHGNAANVTNHFPLTLFLVENGYQVFCFDYRGYGQSQGRITRKGAQSDVKAAIDYVKSRDDVDPQRLLLFGQSLGGAMTIVEAANRDDIRGIVIESTFTSYYAIARSVMLRSIILAPLAPVLPYLLLSPGLHPIDYVDELRAPVLFIHGTADNVIPCRMSPELFDKAPKPKELILIDGMNHLEGLRMPLREYRAPILDFFQRCLEDEFNKENTPD